MPAVPPEAGVGCMTPNWTLVAALEEAMYRALGARYQSLGGMIGEFSTEQTSPLIHFKTSRVAGES